MKQFTIFFLIMALIMPSICQDSSDYQVANIPVDEYLKISLPSDTFRVTISVISVDDSSFSAYLLDYSTYISDMSDDSFENGDVLNHYCTDFYSCNVTVDINSNLDYVIIIVNENLIEDGVVEYAVIYYDESSSVEFIVIIVIASVLVFVVLSVIVALIIYMVKKNKQ